jgi:lipopolysaccharide export system protein LptC
MFKSNLFKAILSILILVIIIIAGYFGNIYYNSIQKRKNIAQFTNNRDSLLKDYENRLKKIDSSDPQDMYTTNDVNSIHLVQDYRDITKSLEDNMTKISTPKYSESTYAQEKLIAQHKEELFEINKLNKTAPLVECFTKAEVEKKQTSPFNTGTPILSTSAMQNTLLIELQVEKKCSNSEDNMKKYIKAEEFLVNMNTFLGANSFEQAGGERSQQFMIEYSKLKNDFQNSFGLQYGPEVTPTFLKEITNRNKESTQVIFDQIINQNKLTKNLSTGLYE